MLIAFPFQCNKCSVQIANYGDKKYKAIINNYFSLFHLFPLCIGCFSIKDISRPTKEKAKTNPKSKI